MLTQYILPTLNYVRTNPGKIIGGVTVVLYGAYQYGGTALYTFGSVVAMPILSKGGDYYARRTNNPAMFDFSATLAEFMHKILWIPNWVDAYDALESGINNSNLRMIDMAIIHNANLNKENADGIRPVESTLKKGQYEMTERLITGGADLSLGANDGKTNLFHKVIESGAKGPVWAAMRQAKDNPALIASKNEESQNLAHLIAANPFLQEVAFDLKLFSELKPKHVDATSGTAGCTPVKDIMHAYKYESGDAKVTILYLQTASANTIQPFFKYITQDPTLKDIALDLTNKPGFDFNHQDKWQKIPLDYLMDAGFSDLKVVVDRTIDTAVTMEYPFPHQLMCAQVLQETVNKAIGIESTSDEVANYLVSKSVRENTLLNNKHLLYFYRIDNEEVRDMLIQVLLPNRQAKEEFALNPLGDNTETILHLFAENDIRYDEEEFLKQYGILKGNKKNPMNPFTYQNAEKLNVLVTAIQYGNMPVYQTIIGKIIEDGQAGNHLTLLVDQAFLSSLFQQSPMLEYTAQAMLTSPDFSSMNIKQLALMASKRTSSLSNSQKSSRSKIMITSYKYEETEYKHDDNDLSVSTINAGNYMRQQNDLIVSRIKSRKEFKMERQKSHNNILQRSEEKQNQEGLTGKIEFTDAVYTLIQLQDTLIISGGLLKDIVIHQKFIEAITGLDFILVEPTTGLDFAPAISGGIFFVGGWLNAAGELHDYPWQAAIAGTAIHFGAEWAADKVEPYTQYTSPEDRGLKDFFSKNGGYIFMGVPLGIFCLASTAITGGYTWAFNGMLDLIKTKSSIRFIHALSIYNADVKFSIYNADVKLTEFANSGYLTCESDVEESYMDYLTVKNVAEIAFAGYMGYLHFSTGFVSLATLTAVPKVLFTVKLIFSTGVRTYAAYGFIKLAEDTIKGGTISFIANSIEESVQSGIENTYSLGKYVYETILEQCYVEESSLQDEVVPFNVEECHIETLGEDTCPANHFFGMLVLKI